MKKALIIARWEFVSTVTRRTYMFAVVALPLVFVMIGAVTAMSSRWAATRAPSRPAAVVDQAQVVDSTLVDARAAPPTGAPAPGVPPSPQLIMYGDAETALADLRANKVATVFIVDPEYIRTGLITSYSSDTGFLSLAIERQRQALGEAIRAALLRRVLSGDALQRAFAPVASMKRFRLGAGGGLQPLNDGQAVASFAGPMIIFLLLTMAIFFSGGFLQQATLEDRQSRMIEILFSSVNADQLLTGKLLGLGAAGLLQVAIYIALVAIPGASAFALIKLSIARLLLSLAYFIIGYLLFATLMGATGMVGRTPQESAQMSMLWTLGTASPMFFLTAVVAAPNGGVARVLSFFPLSSPVTMLLRLSNGEVPVVDIVASLAIGAISIYFALRGTARIFRAASLMYGKRPTLPELVRWLRAA